MEHTVKLFLNRVSPNLTNTRTYENQEKNDLREGFPVPHDNFLRLLLSESKKREHFYLKGLCHTISSNSVTRKLNLKYIETTK